MLLAGIDSAIEDIAKVSDSLALAEKNHVGSNGVA